MKERERTGSQIRPWGTITHWETATASREIRSESYFFSPTIIFPLPWLAWCWSTETNCSLALVFFFAANLKAEWEKEKGSKWAQKKGNKMVRGRKSKANEWSNDFLMIGPLYMIEGREEKLIATIPRIEPLKDTRTLYLHFASYRCANQSHVFVFYVDGCTYPRPDIRGNSQSQIYVQY